MERAVGEPRVRVMSLEGKKEAQSITNPAGEYQLEMQTGRKQNNRVWTRTEVRACIPLAIVSVQGWQDWSHPHFTCYILQPQPDSWNLQVMTDTKRVSGRCSSQGKDELLAHFSWGWNLPLFTADQENTQ